MYELRLFEDENGTGVIDHLEEADDLLLELADHLEVRVNLAEQEADDVREVARRRPDRKVEVENESTDGPCSHHPCRVF